MVSEGVASSRAVRTAELIEQLLAIAHELEAIHPGRKFPLDGHLVTRGVAIRPTSREHASAALLVLRLSKTPGIDHEVVYNGPLDTALGIAGPAQNNGQASLLLVGLRHLNAGVADEDRVPLRSARIET